jgi:hypothetical protein
LQQQWWWGREEEQGGVAREDEEEDDQKLPGRQPCKHDQRRATKEDPRAGNVEARAHRGQEARGTVTSTPTQAHRHSLTPRACSDDAGAEHTQGGWRAERDGDGIGATRSEDEGSDAAESGEQGTA